MIVSKNLEKSGINLETHYETHKSYHKTYHTSLIPPGCTAAPGNGPVLDDDILADPSVAKVPRRERGARAESHGDQEPWDADAGFMWKLW